MRSGLLFVLLACKCNAENPAVKAWVEPIDAVAPTGVEVGTAQGIGSVQVPVRLVNQYGVAVPGPDAKVALAGRDLAETSATVSFDALGYGAVTIPAGPAQSVTITVLETPAGVEPGASGTGWIVNGEPAPFAMYNAWTDEPWGSFDPSTYRFMQAVDDGMVVAVNGDLWWQAGDQLQPAQKVASLSEPARGLAAADIDSDGVSDLLTWTTEEVVLLRGRSAGGFAWGGAYEVSGHQIAGAALADVDGDAIVDLIVAFTGSQESGFQALRGDGVWGFTAETEATLMEENVWSVASGDFGGTGDHDVALLVEDFQGHGVIRRYGLGATGWYSAGVELAGDELDNELQEGSYFTPTADLGSEPGDELIIVGNIGNSSQGLAWYSFGESPRQLEVAYAGYRLAIAEITGDGVMDLLLNETDPAQIRVITTDTDDGGFLNRSVSQVPVAGAVGAADFSADGITDVVIASDVFALYPGAVDAEAKWNIAEDGMQTWILEAASPVLVQDLAGDGYPEVFAVINSKDGNGTLHGYLQAWRYATKDETGASTLETIPGGRADIDTGSTAAVAYGLDLAICGSTLYALVEDNGQAVWAYSLSSGGVPTLKGSTSVSGSRIACGDFADGSAVVVAESGGDWTGLDASLEVVSSGNVEGGIGDIAAADTDGSGTVVHTCAGAECSLIAADLDGDGLEEIIQGGSDPSVTGFYHSAEFSLGGLASVGDVDGDGQADVIYVDAEHERVAVYRNLGGSYAPALIFHSRKDFNGPATALDVDADGVLEMMIPSSEGHFLQSKASTSAE